MHCKLINHGLAISYDHTVKPCCEWRYDSAWGKEHQIKNTDLITWHSSQPIIGIQQQLQKDSWPDNCSQCRKIEHSGRHDSIRSYANRSYEDYIDDDIVLEIRPGSTCNFACQTCWPEASSQVAYFYQKAGLVDDQNSQAIKDFSFLKPVAHRIRNVILLGGEPFYDKNCLKFLTWAAENLQAKITMFTNGSMINWDLVSKFKETVTLVFSIDAVGTAAEYIRFGTKWEDVLANYKQALIESNVEVRVNVTSSVFNLMYLDEVIDLLLEQWPTIVTFNSPWQAHFNESVIPINGRAEIIKILTATALKIARSHVNTDQKYNAINAFKDIIHKLNTEPHNAAGLETLNKFIVTMDQLKGVSINEYCDLTAKTLHQ